jgi:hypothetical protein
MNAPAIALIQPFSSGRLLASEFAGRGWRTIAVLVEPVPEVSRNSFDPDRYTAVVSHADDLAGTASALRDLAVSAVLSGDDTGVAVADAVAGLIGVPGNDPVTSARRRDKSAMACSLAVAGIPAPESRTAGSLPEALAQAHLLGWPVIIKPIDSAGADGVRICGSPKELEDAFNAHHSAVNRMGSVNHHLLIQEVISGDLFDCNMVSHRGIHLISDIWQDKKIYSPDGSVIYDYRDLTPRNFPGSDDLVSYTRDVLDTVGIAHGPSHTELMLTDRGPLLIETAARPAGLYAPAAVRDAIGQDQITLTADVIVSAGELAQRRGNEYTRRQHVRNVFLVSHADGVINPHRLRQVLSLPTLHSTTSRLEGGRPVRRTVDLFTCPGTVYLVGPAGQVAADYAAIRQWEAEDLYVWPDSLQRLETADATSARMGVG